MKLAQLHAVLANGGVKVIPHVTLNFKDKLTKNFKEIFLIRCRKLFLNGWSVVDKGSGVGAKIEGYRIGENWNLSKGDQRKIYKQEVCSFVNFSYK